MKDIMLRMIGKQISRNNETEDNEIEFITQARAYRKFDSIYIVYNETEITGVEGMKTTWKIGDDGKVKLKRFTDDKLTGSIICFSKGCRFDGFYETPYGSFPMEVLTNSIEVQIDKDLLLGSLDIDYDLALKGLSETRTLLTIELSDVSSRPECEVESSASVHSAGEGRTDVN